MGQLITIPSLTLAVALNAASAAASASVPRPRHNAPQLLLRRQGVTSGETKAQPFLSVSSSTACERLYISVFQTQVILTNMAPGQPPDIWEHFQGQSSAMVSTCLTIKLLQTSTQDILYRKHHHILKQLKHLLCSSACRTCQLIQSLRSKICHMSP